jgi:chromosome segregation ATPase
LNEIEKVCELEGAMNKTLALAEATLAAERQTMQEKEARYVREVDLAVAAAEEVRARLEESERMRRAVVQESYRMEREQQEATAHAADLETEVARLQEEVCTAHKEASCLQGRLEAQLATLQTQLENIIQGQTQLEDIIQRNQHEKEEFQDRIKKLEADREEYQGKLTEAQQHVQRVQDESAEAQAKADAALERMENEMADLRVTLAEAKQHQLGEETRSSCKCSEFQVLQQQLQECEMQLVGARQTEAAMHEEARSLREKNDDLQEKIEDLQVKLVETVETQVLASRGGSAEDKRERGASCEDLRELREKTFRLQDVESKLVAAEERVYITEEELQQACDTAEELRQQLQEARQEVRVLSSELQKVSGRSGSREKEIQETNKEELEKVVADLRRQLANAQADGGGGYGPGGLGHGGGAASGDGEESIGEEIEEEVMCDGFCETAEELRRRLSALEREKDREMEERLKEGELKSAMILQTQRLEAELKHAQDELAKERERRERRLELLSKGDDDSFDNEAECKGGCETAQQLRHEVCVCEQGRGHIRKER